mgnify:CR=1 FL=1
MVELGLLTDAAGNKLTDLGGLTFAETLSAGFDRVVEAINRLASALTGVGDSAQQAFQRIPREVNVDVKFNVGQIPDFKREVEVEEFPSAQYGGVTTGGGLVNVHPDEVIAPLPAGDNLFGMNEVMDADLLLEVRGMRRDLRVLPLALRDVILITR